VSSLSFLLDNHRRHGGSVVCSEAARWTLLLPGVRPETVVIFVDHALSRDVVTIEHAETILVEFDDIRPQNSRCGPVSFTNTIQRRVTYIVHQEWKPEKPAVFDAGQHDHRHDHCSTSRVVER
jgi:hypothetical protein